MNNAIQPHTRKLFFISITAVILCLFVIAIGAFVRLSHAGLGCPDWPGCYGKITWPTQTHEITQANMTFPERPVEIHKAWREMTHRFIAGLLLILVAGIAYLTHWSFPSRRWLITTGIMLVIASVFFYTQQQITIAFTVFATALGLFIYAAFRWQQVFLGRTAITMLALILVQAVFGQWTVTLKLKPIIVTMHLLLGMTLFSLLIWFATKTWLCKITRTINGASIKPVLITVGIVLVMIQIALGGWTSANYAAMACGIDFPKCAGAWWPQMDFKEAFILWRGIGVNYEGGILDSAARTAIQWSHRLFAVLVAGHVLMLAARTIQIPQLKGHGIIIAIALLTQIVLGISNVLFALPLSVATAHNAVAAILLGSLVALLARARQGGIQQSI